jgi:hypothetical protein
LDFYADTEGLRLTGPLRFAETAVRADWQETFTASAPLQRRIDITADGLALTALGDWGFDLSSWLRGTAAIRAEAEFWRDDRGEIQLAADLLRTEMNLAPLRWRKPSGVPGRLTADIRLQGKRPVAIENLTIDAGTLNTLATIAFDPETHAFARAEATHLIVGRTDLAHPRLRRHGNAWRIAAAGGVVDLAPWLDPTEEAAPEAAAGPSDDPQAAAKRRASPPENGDARPGTRDLGLILGPVTLDRVWCTRDRFIEEVKLRVEKSPERWHRILVTGRYPRSESDDQIGEQTESASDQPVFAIGYLPTYGGTDSLQVAVPDLGGLLRACGITENFLGGRLRIQGASEMPGSLLPLRVWLSLDHWGLRSESTALKMFAGSSLSELAEKEDGEGLVFDSLLAQVTWQDGRLQIDELAATGSRLGLTTAGVIDYSAGQFDARGTFVPLRGLNTVLGSIPIIGNIFSSGEGFLAADYTLTGPLADPQLEIKPLSVITPDFLKK